MMDAKDAEEFTAALGLARESNWRQIALGLRLGVPEALGMNAEEWVTQRFGGYVRLAIEERREAVVELAREGMTIREIAAVIGTGKSQVHRDLVPFGTAPSPASSPTALPATKASRNGTRRPAGRNLTPDEKREILARVQAGEMQKVIAASLDISPSAVSATVQAARRSPAMEAATAAANETSWLLNRIQGAVRSWRVSDDGWISIAEAARRARALREVIDFLDERRAGYAEQGAKLLREEVRG
ncbi:MAG TPA: hypothetical protein VLI07_18710 [Candidatus Binatus sp.]|nr:hypothetical protein [Candidatus Binatus sp.]